ncbi:MAG: RNA ligase family protein [Candidatus Paceibacterota bacterium]
MYNAKVVKLSIKPHPNADRLQLGYVQGIQVVVGNDVKDGDIGVFFPCDGQLSNEFLSTHNLYRHSELNKDTAKTGYFSDNGRVTAEKIRGERSEGFYCSLSDFEYTGYDLSKLELGTEFDELNGHNICQKYYTPATLRAMKRNSGNSGKAKRTQADYNLPRHFDTEQLQYNLDKVESGDLVIITEKTHGTSTRIGFVQVERQQQLKWWQKLYNLLPLPKYPTVTKNYEFVVGSRNRIVDSTMKPESSEYYRLETAEPLRGLLKKGEVIYAEIVGFDSNGKPIMNHQSTSKLPEIKKQYGEVMVYRYGCRWNEVGVPQRRMFVYRITQVNEDGQEIDLSWAQIKRRAGELGLEVVPQLDLWLLEDLEQEDLQAIVMGYSDKLVVGNSTLDSTHIREGVVVRLEKANGLMKCYKHKSFEFKILEGILKADDNYVDTEEVS